MKITEYDIFMESNRLAVLATTAIERAMKRIGLKRSDLAAKLDMPRSRVTKVLDGGANVTLKTLAAFGLACGVRWTFGGIDIADGSVVQRWSRLPRFQHPIEQKALGTANQPANDRNDENEPIARRFLIQIPGRPEGSISVPEDITEEECEFVDLTVQMLKLYAKRRAAMKMPEAPQT